MLTILRSRAKTRNFFVYDFEWVPGTMEIRVCGLYDGSDEKRPYRCYRTIDEFLDAVLTSENRGKWFYAHAGGMADVQFVLEAIVKRCGMTFVPMDSSGVWLTGEGGSYEVEARFSGSSAIIVDIRQGKNVWHFVDSYWLLRDSLRNIGKSVGLAKTGPDDETKHLDSCKSVAGCPGCNPEYRTDAQRREWYRSVALPTLIDYNRRDCEILWRAIWEFQGAVKELGGQLQMTIASTGLSLFRRKFLSRDIATWDYSNAKAELAYFASRVEVFNRYAGEGYYYDINSSFPYSMTFPCPAELKSTSRRIPLSYAPERIFIADVTVDVPEGYITPVPFRHTQNRVFFPVGTWRGWLSSIDLEMLESEGGTIQRLHEALHFHSFDDLSNYAKTIYALRKAAADPFERLVYKYLLNCLYGKFAESTSKSTFYYNPDLDRLSELRDPLTGMPNVGVEQLFPGAWLQDKEVEVEHRHVPISMHITARSRKTIFDYMRQASTYHYCDTDGFSTTDVFPTSNELGGLKLEKFVSHAEFIAPKIYALTGRDEKGAPVEIYKAKGMSLGKNLDEQKRKWLALRDGGQVEVERMARINENARRYKSLKPREHTIVKRLNQEIQKKRMTYPDGSTRPWHIDELKENF